MEKLYNDNDSFKQYVDKYCANNEIDVKTAFTHSVVKNVADYYKSADKGKISVEKVDVGCGGAC